MYNLEQTEHDAVLTLNAEYRQAHFLQKIKEIQGLYIIVDSEGPFLICDLDEDENGMKSNVLPVFCHETYANDYIKAQHIEGAQVKFVSAKVFKEKWQPFLKENFILLAIMPVSDEFCVLEDLSFEN